MGGSLVLRRETFSVAPSRDPKSLSSLATEIAGKQYDYIDDPADLAGDSDHGFSSHTSSDDSLLPFPIGFPIFSQP